MRTDGSAPYDNEGVIAISNVVTAMAWSRRFMNGVARRKGSKETGGMIFAKPLR
ncbi:hypothetical protein RRSWK_07096 [Rhodopirellula sp. SWK7]|nr:hypothetical protein RRSWK_07096 [Rhodopirellula sp. SWK7]